MMALKTYNQPQLGIAETLLFMPDLLHFWLSGVKASEYSIASTSQMLDARTRRWDDGCCKKLEAADTYLQDIVAPGTQLGTLRADVAARCNLAANTPIVVPGSHDTASAIACRAGAGRKLGLPFQRHLELDGH
jgi:rhamnulokinase